MPREKQNPILSFFKHTEGCILNTTKKYSRSRKGKVWNVEPSNGMILKYDAMVLWW